MRRDYGSGTPFGGLRSQDVTSSYDTRTDRAERARQERVMTQWGLDVLFNPAKRHMDEEKRRLQSTREEIGDASGGKRIDLESGKVVIARSGDEDEAATDDGDGDNTGVSDASGGEDRADQNDAADNPSARARARRRALRKDVVDGVAATAQN